MSPMGNRVEQIHVRMDATGKVEKVSRVRVTYKLHQEAAFSVSREQFPIILAYGILKLQFSKVQFKIDTFSGVTVHKAQGKHHR